MAEEFGIREYLDAKFTDVHGAISGIHTRLDILNGRVGRVETEQAEKRGAGKVWYWIAGSGGGIAIIALGISLLK